MKKTETLIVALFSFAFSFGQFFEGKVVYQNVYDTKNPQTTDHQWESMMGAKNEYYIKNGNYKSVLNGSLVQWQVYLQKENKIYSKMYNSENAFGNDALIKNDSIISYTINEKFTAILGHTCDELILICKSGTQKYYFNEKFKLNTTLFKNHLYGNWYEYLKIANAVPLKMIIENSQFKLTSTAVSIDKMKIPIETFDIH